MAASTKFSEFLQHVRERTVRGELAWEETPQPDAFKSLLHNGTIVISKGMAYGEDADDDRQWVRIELLTPEGRLANQWLEKSDKNIEAYLQLANLWEIVLPKARKGDQLLDLMLEEVR